MKYLTLALASFTAYEIFAQSVDWTANWGGDLVARFNYAPLLAPDGAGSVYATTMFGGTVDMDGHVIEGPGIFLAKLNEQGTTQWVKRFGESTGSPMILNEERPLAIAYDPVLDEVVVVGAYNTRLIFDNDTLYPNADPEVPRLYIARFSSDGECLWARYATRVGDPAIQIVIDGGSKLHIAGTTDGTFQGPPDITIPWGGYHAVYAANGELLSAERVIENGSIHGLALLPNDRYAVIIDAFQNTEIFGIPLIASPGVSSTVTVAVTDLISSVDWVVHFRGSGYGVGAFLCEFTGAEQIVFRGAFNDSLYLTNDTIEGPTGMVNQFVASLDLDGELRWVNLLHSQNTVYVGDQFDADASGNVYLQGSFRESLGIGGAVLHANTSRSGFLVKLDPAGICRAAWDYGGVVNSFGSVVTSDDGVHVSCSYDSVLHFLNSTFTPEHLTGGWPSIFIAHLDSLTGFTGVQALTGGGPQALHIYANPNNGICTLELPESLQPTPDLLLSVYDNTGHLVQRAPLQFSENGLVLDIRAQARGVYHVELGDGQQRYTGTIVFE